MPVGSPTIRAILGIAARVRLSACLELTAAIDHGSAHDVACFPVRNQRYSCTVGPVAIGEAATITHV